LEQHRRVVGGPTRRGRLSALEAQFGQIKLIDKGIDRANWIVVGNAVVKPLWKQHDCDRASPR